MTPDHEHTEDDEPACWSPDPTGTARCGHPAGHDGDHYYNIWEI